MRTGAEGKCVSRIPGDVENVRVLEGALGQATYEQRQALFVDGGLYAAMPVEGRSYSEKTASVIDTAVMALLAAAFDKAAVILTKKP